MIISKFAEKIYRESPSGRRDYLLHYLVELGATPEIHKFVSAFGYGYNLIVDLKGEPGAEIVVTAHYDGIGIYDNVGGVLTLLMLIEHLLNARRRGSFKLVFTDQEESFQQGSKYFLQDFYLQAGSGLVSRIGYHVNLDGFGIGDHIVERRDDAPLLRSWNPFGPDSSLLTDCEPFSFHGVTTIHLFSTRFEDGRTAVEEQALTSRFLPYFDETWCLHNFDESILKTTLVKKILKRFLNLQFKPSKRNEEMYHLI
jgi:hypothetical protein